jgi:hypothetical protein
MVEWHYIHGGVAQASSEFWGVEWLCTKFAPKRTKKPKKVSFHAQNQQKSNSMCITSVLHRNWQKSSVKTDN